MISTNLVSTGVVGRCVHGEMKKAIKAKCRQQNIMPVANQNTLEVTCNILPFKFWIKNNDAKIGIFHDALAKLQHSLCVKTPAHKRCVASLESRAISCSRVTFKFICLMGGHFPNVGRQILTLELMFQIQNNVLSFDGQQYYVFWREIGTRMHITVRNSNKSISCQHVKDAVV